MEREYLSGTTEQPSTDDKLRSDLREFSQRAQVVAYSQAHGVNRTRNLDRIRQLIRHKSLPRYLRFCQVYFDPESSTCLDLRESLLAAGWKPNQVHSIVHGVGNPERIHPTDGVGQFVRIFSLLMDKFMDEYGWTNEDLLGKLKESVELVDRAAEIAEANEKPSEMVAAARAKKEIVATLGDTYRHREFYAPKKVEAAQTINIAEMKVLINSAPKIDAYLPRNREGLVVGAGDGADVPPPEPAPQVPEG